MIKKKCGRKSKRPNREAFELLYEKCTAKQLALFYGVSVQTIYQWSYQFRKEDSS